MRHRLVALVLALAGSAAARPPGTHAPERLRPAKTVNSAPYFVDGAAETEILQPEPHERAVACLAQDTGGLANEWRGVQLRGVYRVPGYAQPVAILQAMCVFGHVGFETHTWAMDTRTMTPMDLGGTTRFDDVIATTRGLLAVTWLDKVQGAPGRCRYALLRREVVPGGGIRLVPQRAWEAPITGEGLTASCHPFAVSPGRPAAP